MSTLEIGDMVDVDMESVGILPVRIIEFVDDVREETGYTENDPAYRPDLASDRAFIGPGFIGEIDPSSGESGQLVFSLKQVVPNSKLKYYFPQR